MSPENTTRLFDDFPALFRGRFRPITENLMGFGFECGDGWFSLIHSLCAQIAAHAKSNKLHPLAVQVKEKYGSLRFYIHGADARINDRVEAADRASESICEVCGAPGRVLQRADG